MPHLITILAIVYVVLVAIYLAYVPDEDFGFLVAILLFVVPLTVLAITVDKIWG